MNKTKTYPVVMKNKDTLEVIYRNRVEIYKLTNTDTFSKEEGRVQSPECEVEMCQGENMKRVNDSNNDKHWGIWNNAKDKTKNIDYEGGEE